MNIRVQSMTLQITNPVVVAKVERLARSLGLTKTAVVERAIDRLASEVPSGSSTGRMAAILEQIDRVPDRPDAFDPLEWASNGLPK
jgi:antitoxin VapB